MIKKYRNFLLAAAVASLVAGCGGGDGSNSDDLTQDPDFVNNLINNPDRNELTHQATVNLVASILQTLITSTDSIFETFDIVSSGSTSVGKVMGAATGSNSPSGIKATISGTCTGGVDQNGNRIASLPDDQERFVIEAELAAGPSGAQPVFEKLFEEMTAANVLITADVAFKLCNEPEHEYDDDPNTPPTSAESPDRLLDGDIDVVLKSSNVISGDEANDKDFKATINVKLDSYFIKTPESPTPDALSGAIDVSLYTTNVDTDGFAASLGLNMSSNDGLSRDYNDTIITATGRLDVDGNFNVGGYNLELGGTLINFSDLNVTAESPSRSKSYVVVTRQNITLSGSDGSDLNPTGGEFGILDTENDFLHTAAVTATGLEFVIQTDSAGGTREASCTWTQIENNDCNI